MGTLTIRLDEALERDLKRMAMQTGRTKGELVREALRRMLAVQRFRARRERALPLAAAAGYMTEDDVFRDVS